MPCGRSQVALFPSLVPSPTPSFSSLAVRYSDEKLGVGLGTRLIVSQAYPFCSSDFVDSNIVNTNRRTKNKDYKSRNLRAYVINHESH